MQYTTGHTPCERCGAVHWIAWPVNGDQAVRRCAACKALARYTAPPPAPEPDSRMARLLRDRPPLPPVTERYRN